MQLDDILSTVLDGRTKGIPANAAPFPLREIGQQGWSLLAEDLPFPQLVLKQSALDHNARVFGDYLAQHNLSIAPHGKTTMAPQLYDHQLRHGAWAITAANVAQVAVMHHYGVDRVVLANQLLGRAHMVSVADMIAKRPEFELYVFVDSVAQMDNMARNLDGIALDRPIRLLIEVGVTGGRTGLRTRAEADAIAQAILSADPTKFRFAGVAGFESVVPGIDDSLDPIRAYAQDIVDITTALPTALFDGLDEFILTAGGTAFFDLMVDGFEDLNLPVPLRVLLRSGCYVTSDSGGYKKHLDAARDDPSRTWKADLEPALEVWTYVQSCPEPGLAFLAMGKRDAPYDAGLPIPLRRYRPGTGFVETGKAEIFAMNDQHAFVRLGEGADWQVGDLVASGISHPCTAFDKWRFLPVVDDDYTVIDGILTFF